MVTFRDTVLTANGVPLDNFATPETKEFKNIRGMPTIYLDEKIRVVQGPPGNDGKKGDKGYKGDQGPQGPRGDRGRDGRDGVLDHNFLREFLYKENLMVYRIATIAMTRDRLTPEQLERLIDGGTDELLKVAKQFGSLTEGDEVDIDAYVRDFETEYKIGTASQEMKSEPYKKALGDVGKEVNPDSRKPLGRYVEETFALAYLNARKTQGEKESLAYAADFTMRLKDLSRDPNKRGA